MLRFDYLPSDFNPMFLFLGERQDLTALAGLLRSFASSPRQLDVREQMPLDGVVLRLAGRLQGDTGHRRSP